MADFITVGQVFKVFPGGKGLDYFGIEVTGGPFKPGAKLRFRPPDGDGSNDVLMKVATIEIERNRANVALTGNRCAIRPSQSPSNAPGPNWTVLVNSSHSESAGSCQQELTPRPTKPTETPIGKKMTW